MPGPFAGGISQQANLFRLLQSQRKELRYLEANRPGSAFPPFVDVDAELKTEGTGHTLPDGTATMLAVAYGTTAGGNLPPVFATLKAVIDTDPGTGPGYTIATGIDNPISGIVGAGICVQVSTGTVYPVYALWSFQVVRIICPGVEPTPGVFANQVRPEWPFAFDTDDVVFDGILVGSEAAE